MTKPTPKPTVASLQRELADMTERAALYEQSSQEHAQIREEQAETLTQVRVSDFGTAQNRIMTIALPPKETP